MITTTLNRIRAHSPCREGWTKLLRHLGKTEADDEPLPFAVIVASNGIDDALWCCRAEPGHDREWRLYAVWCARQVQHLMTDPRSTAALDVAERYARGEATHDELAAARTAVGAAAWGAAAWGAARTAAWAAAEAAVRAAVGAAAWAAAEAAAEAAAWAAARAAVGAAVGAAAQAAAWAAAEAATEAAVGAAAQAAAWAAQRARFLEIVG